MIEVLVQYIIGFVIALSGTLTPGPLLVFVINHTLRVRRRTVGLLAALGHCSVEMFIILAIVLGLSVVFESAVFQWVVKVVGGVVMVVFGALSLLEARRGRFEVRGCGADYGSFVGGTLFTVFNVTVPVWWATVGLAMLNAALEGTTVVGVLFWVLGHWSADVAWFSFAGYSVFRGKDYVGRGVHRFLILACGLVLVGIGLFFLVSSLWA
ncbi:MAG: LysE family transporter [Candidatus Bathyarchaeia archaeon]